MSAVISTMNSRQYRGEASKRGAGNLRGWETRTVTGALSLETRKAMLTAPRPLRAQGRRQPKSSTVEKRINCRQQGNRVNLSYTEHGRVSQKCF